MSDTKTGTQWEEKTVVKLRRELKKRKLSAHGRKRDLVKRLKEADQNFQLIRDDRRRGGGVLCYTRQDICPSTSATKNEQENGGNCTSDTDNTETSPSEENDGNNVILPIKNTLTVSNNEQESGANITSNNPESLETFPSEENMEITPTATNNAQENRENSANNTKSMETIPCEEDDDKTEYTIYDLHRAAHSGDLGKVKQLIEKVDINGKDGNGWTALHVAAWKGQRETCQFLLEKGADLHAKTNNGWTALHVAAWYGQRETCQFLLEKGADLNAKTNKGWTALHLAAEEGQRERCQFLLEKGADLHAKTDTGNTPLHLAIQSNKINVTNYLVSNGASVTLPNNDGHTALHLGASTGHISIWLNAKQSDLQNAGSDLQMKVFCAASKQGNLAVVTHLMKLNVDMNGVDANGNTPLHCAIINGQYNVTDYLLSQGAKVIISNSRGETALDLATSYGIWNVWLKANKTNVEKVDKKVKTKAFYKASRKGKLDVVSHLVHLHTDVNMADEHGLTPLMAAAQGGSFEVCEYLCSKEANTCVSDNKGNTVLMYACQGGNLDIVTKLAEEILDILETNDNKENAFNFAAKHKHNDVLQYLVSLVKKKGTLSYVSGGGSYLYKWLDDQLNTLNPAGQNMDPQIGDLQNGEVAEQDDVNGEESNMDSMMSELECNSEVSDAEGMKPDNRIDTRQIETLRHKLKQQENQLQEKDKTIDEQNQEIGELKMKLDNLEKHIKACHKCSSLPQIIDSTKQSKNTTEVTTQVPHPLPKPNLPLKTINTDDLRSDTQSQIQNYPIPPLHSTLNDSLQSDVMTQSLLSSQTNTNVVSSLQPSQDTSNVPPQPSLPLETINIDDLMSKILSQVHSSTMTSAPSIPDNSSAITSALSIPDNNSAVTSVLSIPDNSSAVTSVPLSQATSGDYHVQPAPNTHQTPNISSQLIPYHDQENSLVPLTTTQAPTTKAKQLQCTDVLKQAMIQTIPHKVIRLETEAGKNGTQDVIQTTATNESNPYICLKQKIAYKGKKIKKLEEEKKSFQHEIHHLRGKTLALEAQAGTTGTSAARFIAADQNSASTSAAQGSQATSTITGDDSPLSQYIDQSDINTDVITANSATHLVKLFLKRLFSEDHLCDHRASETGTSKSNRPALDQDIVSAIISYVQSIYPSSERSRLVWAINQSCADARKKKRRHEHN